MIKQRPVSLTTIDGSVMAHMGDGMATSNKKKMQAADFHHHQQQQQQKQQQKQQKQQQQSSCCGCHQVCCGLTPATGGTVLDLAVGALWLLTPVTATLSLVMMCVAMGTNQWLHSEERMPSSNYNGTGERNYLSKHTVSGLWTLCYTNPGERELQCFNIDYFPREEYSPDPNDSTMAIPYAVTKSAAFYILATLFIFVGEFCCCFGHFSRQRRIFTFISGIIFIISGLLVLIGLVMYISVFKAEIGSKLRPRSSLQPPLFTYRYGFSFVLIVSGFMSTEVAGTCAIFLYIYWHQLDWSHKSSNNVLLAVPPPPHLATVHCQRHHHRYNRPPVQPLRRYSYGSGSAVTSPAPPPPPPALTRYGHYATMPRSSTPRLPDEDSGAVVQYETNSMGLRSHSQGTLAADRQLVRDSYYSSFQQVQGIPRDVTCNTMSTTADVACSPHEFVTFHPHHGGHERIRREYSYETLRKTTPV